MFPSLQIGAARGDELGSKVQLNSAGNLLAIGVPKSNVPFTNSGHVDLLKHQLGQWVTVRASGYAVAHSMPNVCQTLCSSISGDKLGKLEPQGSVTVVKSYDVLNKFMNVVSLWVERCFMRSK